MSPVTSWAALLSTHQSDKTLHTTDGINLPNVLDSMTSSPSCLLNNRAVQQRFFLFVLCSVRSHDAFASLLSRALLSTFFAFNRYMMRFPIVPSYAAKSDRTPIMGMKQNLRVSFSRYNSAINDTNGSRGVLPRRSART